MPSLPSTISVPKKKINLVDEFWCELALSLGCTIAELQKKMSIKELNLWRAYRAKYGPLNPVRKYDRPAALICASMSAALGGNAKIMDFMPFGRDENDFEEPP